MPKSIIRKRLAAPIMQRIVEHTAEMRGIPWEHILSASRERPEVADARVLAMAVCCAAGVPPATVAKVFGRTWQTVDSARERIIMLVQDDSDLLDEFIAILTRSLRP